MKENSLQEHLYAGLKGHYALPVEQWKYFVRIKSNTNKIWMLRCKYWDLNPGRHQWFANAVLVWHMIWEHPHGSFSNAILLLMAQLSILFPQSSLLIAAIGWRVKPSPIHLPCNLMRNSTGHPSAGTGLQSGKRHSSLPSKYITLHDKTI